MFSWLQLVNFVSSYGYMDIGHNDNSDIYKYHEGKFHIQPAEYKTDENGKLIGKAHDDIWPETMSGEILKGRIDHKQKMISVVSPTDRHGKYVGKLLSKMYPHYRIEHIL